MNRDLIRSLLPGAMLDYLRSARRRRQQAAVRKLPQLTEADLRTIVTDRLGVQKGDLIFVHSSIDRLHLAFPFYQILSMLRSILGEEGTMIFPTYPKLTSYKFLVSGEMFDVRKTPSYTGALTEFARRQRDGIRSLHPTKSVVAIGPLAAYLTDSHHISPYPYDKDSPYFRLVEKEGKAIGIGVRTANLSMVHTVDDDLKKAFPVKPYAETLFQAPCRDYSGTDVVVPTYAHDMRKMDFDIPSFMKAHIPEALSQDLLISGMPFFRAEAAPLFERMRRLASEGITIYRQRHYTR